MKFPIDDTIRELLDKRLRELEEHFNADVISFTGPIIDGTENKFLQIIEDLVAAPEKKDTLFLLLTTPGGSAVAVERYVNIIRHHYTEVHFVVPDYAYSAGTIFCMSGDSIHMDYYSVLGPIDPQVQNKDGKLVAALGYLDKVKELVKKDQDGELTQAEFIILKEFDLAELRGYEQAKELTIDLLKKWLVKYKFKNWKTHETAKELKGQLVSEGEKMERAETIAAQLSDNNCWKSHGRPINIDVLENVLKLKIDDYSKNNERRKLIRTYSLLSNDYIQKNNLSIFVHTRRFI